MRILCGILSGFVVLNILWLIFAIGGHDRGPLAAMIAYYSAMGVLLLWLAAGQPLTFSAASQGTAAKAPGRIRLGMRILGGVLGLLNAAIFGAICVLLVRNLSTDPSFFAGMSGWNKILAIVLFLFFEVWHLIPGLMAWVFLRLAFMNRPLPPSPRMVASVLSPA